MTDDANVVGDRRVVASVLTWRGYEATRACLTSLQSLDAWPIPTLVVDNHSGTGEGTRLATEFGPPVEVLELRENGGVPSGYNAAMRSAAERGADYLLLLNNDTLITDPAMLTRLVGAMEDGVAAVGPIVRNPDGSIFSAGGWMDWRHGRGRFWQAPLRMDRPYDAEWLDGACMLVSIEAARRIGGFAPEYFMYWEELDWCIRGGKAGLRCVVQPETSITHIGPTRTASMQVRYLMLRNGMLFMRRHGSAMQNLTSLAWAIFYKSPGILIRCLGRPRDLVRAPGIIVSAFWWNIADAIRRRRWRLPADGPPIGARGGRQP